jgi:hypothetical protein
MATALATLKISKAIGADGQDIAPQIKFEGGAMA